MTYSALYKHIGYRTDFFFQYIHPTCHRLHSIHSATSTTTTKKQRRTEGHMDDDDGDDDDGEIIKF